MGRKYIIQHKGITIEFKKEEEREKYINQIEKPYTTYEKIKGFNRPINTTQHNPEKSEMRGGRNGKKRSSTTHKK